MEFLVADTYCIRGFVSPSVGPSVRWSVMIVKKWENTHFRSCPPVRNWWPCIRPCFECLSVLTTLHKCQWAVLCMNQSYLTFHADIFNHSREINISKKSRNRAAIFRPRAVCNFVFWIYAIDARQTTCSRYLRKSFTILLDICKSEFNKENINNYQFIYDIIIQYSQHIGYPRKKIKLIEQTERILGQSQNNWLSAHHFTFTIAVTAWSCNW